MASTSCPLCDAWTVGFEYDLETRIITWYCLKCGHRWRRPQDDPTMNVPKLVLAGAGVSIGLLGLAVLVALKVADDCAKRAGWR